MSAKITISRVRSIIWKIISGAFFYTCLTVLLALLLVQIPFIQTQLAQQALGLLKEKTPYEVSLAKLKIAWLDRVYFDELLIRDFEKDTLFYAEELFVDYQIADLINGEYLSIEEIEAHRTRLKLVKYDSAEFLNLSAFIKSFRKDSVKSAGKPLEVDIIMLTETRVTLENQQVIAKDAGLDFNNIDFHVPDLAVGHLVIRSDTIAGSILQMRAEERNAGLTLDEFTTVFRLCKQSLSLDDLNLRTPNSHIADSLEFFYNGYDDFSHFTDSVSFILHFQESRISYKDLKTIIGKQVVYADITIDGIIWGTVGDFNIEQTRFGYGRSYFVGGVSCFGLPNISESFLLADLSESRLYPDDLSPYIGSFVDNLKQMGRIDFNGSYAGYFHNFVARGDFETDKGAVHTDINIRIPDDPKEMSYVGNLAFRDVELGSLLKNKNLGVINLKARVDGKGITINTADFDLEALAYKSSVRGYTYDTIRANGRFAKNFFRGTFGVEDTNCSLSGQADIDFTHEIELMDVNVAVQNIAFDSLNLSKDPVSAFGNINFQVRDLDLDKFEADLHIDSSEVVVGPSIVVLDSIRFAAFFEAEDRVFTLDMPGFRSNLRGDFDITSVIKDLPVMFSGYIAKLKLQSDSVYQEPSGDSYEFQLLAEIKDVTPYLDSLDVPVDFSENTIIEATYRQSKNANVSVYVKADSLYIKDHIFLNPRLEINGSEQLNGSQILTSFIFESDHQFIKGIPETFDLLLEGIWFDDEIEITTLMKQPATYSDLRITSAISLSRDSITLRMLPSDIVILKDTWNFNPSNQVIFKDDEITIDSVEIFDSSESVSVNGVYSNSTPTDIFISADDLNFDKATIFSSASIGGFLNGKFNLFRDNDDLPFGFDGSFKLRSLVLDDLEVGDVSGSSVWNPELEHVYSTLIVDREGFNAMAVRGFYYPGNEEDQLDLDANFDQAQLRMGQPFLKDNFSNITGEASGSIKITGTPQNPRIVGNCEVEGGEVTINYLNTHYKFDGEIDFDPRVIRFSNFNLVDRKGQRAVVRGELRHKNFENLIADIEIRATNFEFLNTTSIDNNLYYGSAYGTGRITVAGPVSDLYISANIRTEADTRFFIPVSDETSAGQEEYIRFVNLQDTTAVEEEEFKISGLTLDFEIEVTPDAYCELIFDIKTGEIIKGRGSGNLKLRLDTDGEFSMFGPLEITEGAYNLTIQNLISKEFSVVPGGRITWYGDPYSAILDLDATYLQRASFENLKNPEDQIQSELSNRVPLLVVLYLDGVLTSPDIDFDIQMQNQADASDNATAVLTQIRSNEQELRRQVISLLFLKRFSPRESFSLGGGGGSLSGSFSEVLSSQLSYLVSQIDENLEVELELSDLDREALDNVQLRFAYTFLDGRLKVARGGDFGSEDDGNDNLLNDIVGDWSVEYSLTRDGKLRAKVFRNSTQRILTNTGQQNQETGVSLRFVHSFNDLRELLLLRKEEELQVPESNRSRSVND